MCEFADFCRVCLRAEGELVDLSAFDNDNVKLTDKLTYIGDATSEDCGPNKICESCCTKLQVSYSFKNQYEAAKVALKLSFLTACTNYAAAVHRNHGNVDFIDLTSEEVIDNCRNNKIKDTFDNISEVLRMEVDDSIEKNGHADTDTSPVKSKKQPIGEEKIEENY